MQIFAQKLAAKTSGSETFFPVQICSDTVTGSDASNGTSTSHSSGGPCSLIGILTGLFVLMLH